MPQIDPEEFPSNSRGPIEDDDLPEKLPDAPRKTLKIANAKVIKKKKSFFGSISDTFFGEATKGVGNYILYDVLIPAAKKTISEMITQGIEMLLYGEAKNSNIRREQGRSYVSYTNYYKDRDRDRDRDRRDYQRSRSSGIEDIIIDTRREAEEVLSALADIIDKYGQASVLDFKDLVGVPDDYTDQKYGWESISRASVRRVREGYIIDLPRPIHLED